MLKAVTLDTVHTHTHTHTPAFLNNIFLKIKRKNKDPCCGLRLLYLRI